jgi:hypothetical protein
LDHGSDNRSGATIDYRLEARVRYWAEGKDRDLWLIASRIQTSREILDAARAANPNSCLVYWQIGFPDYAKCRIQAIPSEDVLAP